MEWGEANGSLCGFTVGLKGVKYHVVPIGFVVSNHPLEHGLNDFIDCFNLAISLGVVEG